MSQKKVDQYKKEKANRKQIMKREKMKRRAAAACGTVVSIAVIGWVGYSAFGYFHQKDAENPTQTEVDLSSLTEYLSGLQTEEAAEE
ncbi:MAG: hypothetical protein HFH49_15385 [Lachnospiraceae bacterium]|nr:hypothetical protein [Lachnospiraceae bacterium]